MLGVCVYVYVLRVFVSCVYVLRVHVLRVYVLCVCCVCAVRIYIDPFNESTNIRFVFLNRQLLTSGHRRANESRTRGSSQK